MMGKPVQRQMVTDDEMRAKIAARGAAARAADMVMGLYAATRDGRAHRSIRRWKRFYTALASA